MSTSINYTIHRIQSVDSTNLKLRRDAALSQLPEGTVILADFQSFGKGQGNNIWHSTAGKNICCSILLKPMIEVSHYFVLTEIISLALIDLLADFALEAKIKWPNDIYIGNKKIAGILIENQFLNTIIIQSICGIGLNVNENSFPNYLPNPIAMRELLNREIAIHELPTKLFEMLNNRYQQVKEGKFAELHTAYNISLFRGNQLCTFSKVNETFRARIVQVKPNGELSLELENGDVLDFQHGEIRLIFNETN